MSERLPPPPIDFPRPMSRRVIEVRDVTDEDGNPRLPDWRDFLREREDALRSTLRVARAWSFWAGAAFGALAIVPMPLSRLSVTGRAALALALVICWVKAYTRVADAVRAGGLGDG